MKDNIILYFDGEELHLSKDVLKAIPALIVWDEKEDCYVETQVATFEQLRAYDLSYIKKNKADNLESISYISVSGGRVGSQFDSIHLSERKGGKDFAIIAHCQGNGHVRLYPLSSIGSLINGLPVESYDITQDAYSDELLFNEFIAEHF